MTFGDARLPARFWAKCREQPSGCWIWTGATNKAGYGRFSWGGKGRVCQAYRVSRAVLVGDIEPRCQNPALDVVDHLCSEPRCVHPEHVQPVTQRENLGRSPAWSGNHGRLSMAEKAERSLAHYHRNKATINPRRNARRRLIREES